MLATGVDLVRIERVERILKTNRERFLERIFTPFEQRYAREASELAARFAAKEATAKALGVGMRMLSPLGIGWQEVETRHTPQGQPYLVLYGPALELAQSLGLTEWAVSLSHDGGLAIAMVVGMGK